METTTDGAPTARAIVAVIEIAAREWFDKTGGNSYFSAYVTVSTSAHYEDKRTYVLPFQYGHESQAKFTALRELLNMGAIPSEREHELRAAGYLVIFHRSERNKRDLMTVKDCERVGMPRVAPDVPVFIA